MFFVPGSARLYRSKTTRKVLLLAAVLLCAQSMALQAQSPDIEDLFDTGKGPSPVFDLAETPLWLTLLQMAALEVQDQALKGKFLAEFGGLRSKMDKGSKETTSAICCPSRCMPMRPVQSSFRKDKFFIRSA